MCTTHSVDHRSVLGGGVGVSSVILNLMVVDNCDDLNFMTITLGMYTTCTTGHRSVLARWGGSVINPRVFCIVRSLLV